MREKWIRLWRDFRFPLLIAFGTMPVALLLFAQYTPVLLPFVWAWPLGYILLDALSTRIPGKWRILYGLLELLLLAGCGYFAGTVTGSWLVLIVPGMYCLLLLWGLVLTAEARNDRVGPLWYIVCIGVHLLAQLLQYSARVTENPAIDPVRPWTSVAFFAFAIIGLITLNQANLRFSTSGRQNASLLMQRKNLLLVVGLFAIGLLIACTPAIVKAAGNLLQWLLVSILWLIYNLFGEQEMEQAPGEEAVGQDNLGLPVAGETAQAPQWLTILLTVFVLALVAAVALYALYFLGKKLIVFFKFMTRISGKYLHAVSEDYVDEITDTREGREDQSKARNRKHRLSAQDERKLSPDQRIRYRYLRLMQKHPEWNSGATARETLPADAAPIYERVRYSSHPVTEADAEAFATGTKKV